MAKNTLPTYAIVEILIRLSHFNPLIGDYKDHTAYDTGVIVKTTHGNITLSQALIMRQFHEPESIGEKELIALTKELKPFK